MKQTYLLINIVIALMLLAGCNRQKEQSSAPQVMTVGAENVAKAERRELRLGPTISGNLAPEQSATVRAEVGGTVLAAAAEVGNHVKRGALLARIEERALRDNYTSAQSMVRSAENSLEISQRELERVNTLVKGGALAERDAEMARNAVANAQAQVSDSKARRASAAEQLQRATVVAPLTGVVSDKKVNAGDVVTAGAELYTIINPNSMRLEATVPAEQVGALKTGLPVEFEVAGYAGQTFIGRIDRISPAADPVTKQVPIFISLPNNNGRLVAGLFAQGRVTTERREALVVPASAVNTAGATPWVVRVRDGKAERVTVQTGAQDAAAEQVEIRSGLEPGDVLLTGTVQHITPGTPVQVNPPQASGVR